MYIKTNHIIGRLPFLFFYFFCSYFLNLFIFSYYLFDEHMTTYDCYLSIKIPCYMIKYPICSTFMMAFVTYLDFELLDNGWYSHSISCCNREVLLRWKIFKQIFYIYASIWCHIEKPVEIFKQLCLKICLLISFFSHWILIFSSNFTVSFYYCQEMLNWTQVLYMNIYLTLFTWI